LSENQGYESKRGCSGPQVFAVWDAVA